MAKKRVYSREFPNDPAQKKRRAITVEAPLSLALAVRAKAKRQGISLRALLLGFLKTWVEEP